MKKPFKTTADIFAAGFAVGTLVTVAICCAVVHRHNDIVPVRPVLAPTLAVMEVCANPPMQVGEAGFIALTHLCGEEALRKAVMKDQPCVSFMRAAVSETDVTCLLTKAP